MRFFKWLKGRLAHKFDHFSWASIKQTFKDHGLALVIIIIGWEVIEDILFPVLFIFLGNHVHPAFYAGAPAALLLCVHWIAVPLIWRWWVKMSGGKKHTHDLSLCESHNHEED